ncbi:alpha/beta hydrolase [Luteipulveratus mongoliensis]|uniref:Esterase n=1 Tax=Luteipulveratus mongoliensis TaxID=571913 RepID=A0A0K1JK94_9MICO|nr:alpha/beta fold hydrolase [Luteipulveratus mongoliensis]AKU17137.1 esterase [Luteipulveratus mongoliensis]
MQILPGAEPLSHDGSQVGVLVCHGFTGTTQSMRPIAERCVAEGWTVRMPRLPGHGTTWQDLNKTVWTDWYAEVEAAYAELQERCTHVAVVGLSLGGSLVTLLAEEHDDVAGLVLINPAYEPKDPRLKALPIVKRLVPSLAAIGNDIKKPGVTELAYDRTPLKALHSAVAMWRQVTRDLPQITQPILLMHSPEDHVVEPSNSELLLSRVSSADVTEILLEDSFHVATLDNDAERILDETVDFVRKVCA